MSRIKYRSQGGPKGPEFRRRGEMNRPADPQPGQTIRENGKALIFTGRDWAWFPTTASDLIKFAKAHRWGTSVRVQAITTPAGYGPEGNPIRHTVVKITLLLGREPGATVGGRTAKGFTYRLVWDTSRMGIFELVSWYRRTSADMRWTEVGSVAEIRPIIARNPVLPDRTDSDA